MKYFHWDFDADTVIEYARSGECNGCGACCMAYISFRVVTNYMPSGWRSHNGSPVCPHEGQWLEVRVGDKRRFFGVPLIKPHEERCSALTDDNRCRIHAGKPLFHRAWPMHPDQVAAFPECGYTFREINRQKISELE